MNAALSKVPHKIDSHLNKFQTPCYSTVGNRQSNKPLFFPNTVYDDGSTYPGRADRPGDNCTTVFGDVLATFVSFHQRQRSADPVVDPTTKISFAVMVRPAGL